MKEGAHLAASVGALLTSAATYLVVYRTDAMQPLGPLRNLAATLAATLPLLLLARGHGRALLRTPEWLPDSARGAGMVPQARRRVLTLLLAGTVLLALCPPLGLVEGTDDAYRYLWDGKVLDHGVNPYRHPPLAPELSGLRDERLFPRIFRPEMRTVYPPLAQLWFWIGYRLSPGSLAGFKLLLMLHQLASTLLLWRLVTRSGRPPMRAALYAWSPLAVVQLFAGAHLDGLMVPWVLAAVLLAENGAAAAAGAALGAASMIRPVALLCMPALVLRRPVTGAHERAPRGAPGGLQGSVRGAAAVGGLAAATALLLLPFAGAGASMWESLLVYARHWRFNGSLFQLTRALFDERAREVTYTVVLVGSVAASWRRLRLSLAGRFLLAMGVYYALAPTVYPWYLLPLLALGVSCASGSLLVLGLPALATLSDLVFVEQQWHGRWQVPGAALLLEYGAIFALLGHDVLRRIRRGQSPDERAPGGW